MPPQNCTQAYCSLLLFTKKQEALQDAMKILYT